MSRGSARPVRTIASALLVALALAVGPASAHEVDPSVLTVIDEVVPALPGITIEVGTSVTTELLLENTTTSTIEVLDEAGRAFLRIGPDGVQANLAAPAWYLTNQPFADGAVPAGASRDAPDRWATVSAEPAWGWFDHRLHPSAVASTTGADRPIPFEIPLRSEGRPVVVRGHLEPRRSVPRFGAELLAVPDASSGLVVQLIAGRAPGLFVRYDGTGTVEVAGREGEPFLRLGTAGAEVNRRSPTWLFTAQARGEDLTGVDVDARSAPEWSAVSSSPAYSWIDPRALIERVVDVPVSLDWTIPVVVDGRALQVDGRSTAVVTALADLAGSPSDDGPGAWLLGLAIATLVTVGLAVVLLRGRG